MENMLQLRPKQSCKKNLANPSHNRDKHPTVYWSRQSHKSQHTFLLKPTWRLWTMITGLSWKILASGFLIYSVALLLNPQRAVNETRHTGSSSYLHFLQYEPTKTGSCNVYSLIMSKLSTQRPCITNSWWKAQAHEFLIASCCKLSQAQGNAYTFTVSYNIYLVPTSNLIYCNM